MAKSDSQDEGTAARRATTRTRSSGAGSRSGRPRAPGSCPTRAPPSSTPRSRRTTCSRCSPTPPGEPHVGHLKCYSVGDAIAHFRRRRGFNVIHPMGYDAFGLPAENNAIATGEHPRAATEASIASFREQFKRWGISLDWTREVSSHEPSYYRWTQWIFLKLYEQGLAYREEAPVQWCPVDADRARQRAGDRRPLRALRHAGRAAPPGAVVLQDHRLRRPPARGLRPARVLARARGHDAAQLDRPLRGRRGDLPPGGPGPRLPRLHDAARHALRRHLLRAGPRASRRRAPRRRHRARAGGARLRQRGGPHLDRGARRRGPPEDRRARSGARSPTRSTARGSRCSSPTTC